MRVERRHTQFLTLLAALVCAPLVLFSAAARTDIPYAEAKPIIETFGMNIVGSDGGKAIPARVRSVSLPVELRARTSTELEAAWPEWVSRRDAEIRARLEQGDQDSILHLMLFGVTFTKLPRITDREVLRGLPASARIVRGRLDDLVADIASPGNDERLQFAREILERKGIDPTTEDGREAARRHLDEALKRLVAYNGRYSQQMAPLEKLTQYRDRGLSSDTSILPDFAIEQTLGIMAAKKMLGGAKLRRVAIVGPGLDFTDRREGYDFYRPQTIQPFAVIDSLIRLGLSTSDDLRVTTFDLSPRVNHHLGAALNRARQGDGYVLHLPRNIAHGWNARLVDYWRRFGDRIGEEEEGIAVPAEVGDVRVRTVRVRPEIVELITPEDLNVVLQRLELAPTERFDLIVGTNVFIYYDQFEQSLALANLAGMLGPGGVLLSNSPMVDLPATGMKAAGYSDVAYNPFSTERFTWFHRRAD